MRQIAMPWTTVYAAGTTAIFIPVSAYMPSGNIDKYRLVLELLTRTSATLQVQAAYQEADVETNPDQAQAFGNTVTSEGMEYPSWTTDSFSKQLVRFGYLVKLSEAGSLALARVGGVLELKTC